MLARGGGIGFFVVGLWIHYIAAWDPKQQSFLDCTGACHVESGIKLVASQALVLDDLDSMSEQFLVLFASLLIFLGFSLHQ